MAYDWYISDTHFGHDNILLYEKDARPFADLEEHDAQLIKRWNNLVGPEDRVIHLGDVAFKPATRLDEVLPQLNGKKTLIMGNHDVGNIETYLKYFKIKPCGLVSIPDSEKTAVLTHFPIHDSQLDFRFGLNVHGHTHSHVVQSTKHINISCEQTALRPLAHHELERLMKERVELLRNLGVEI